MYICIVIYTHTTSLNFARLLEKSILVAVTILCWQDSAGASGGFVLPPIFDHHWVNIFMGLMGLVIAGFGYISAWRHKC